MSKMPEVPIVFTRSAQLCRGVVTRVGDDGLVTARLDDGEVVSRCACLQTGPEPLELQDGDEVLVMFGGRAEAPLVLGRIGLAKISIAKPEVAPLPKSVTIEAEQEVVIKNANAKIKITREGVIELVCEGLSARAQRMLRLLAPLIKLN